MTTATLKCSFDMSASFASGGSAVMASRTNAAGTAMVKSGGQPGIGCMAHAAF